MTSRPGEKDADFAWATSLVERLRVSLAEVVLGQEKAIGDLVGALLGGGHALLVGVPGVAKTLLCNTLATRLNLTFSRIQFTPDLLPADITGSEVFDPGRMEWRVSRGPLFAQLVLADEINRAPGKVQSALLEAMQERQVTLGGKTLPLPAGFMVVATQNPVEMEGVYPLPEAQQDRFLARIEMDYPPPGAEARMALDCALGKRVQLEDNPVSTQMLGAEELARLQSIRASVAVDSRLAGYAVDLVGATRSGEWARPLRLGASPRATQALLILAQAKALIQGRAFVVPEDIQNVAPSVLMHRLVPDETLGWSSQDLASHIQTILDQVAVP
jgi:MoxR-like ATPase